MAPVRDSRSEPARSTRFRPPWHAFGCFLDPASVRIPVNFKVNTMCDRDERWFMFGPRVVRAASARRSSDAISIADATSTHRAFLSLIHI